MPELNNTELIKITIITVCLNAKETIEDTIKSVVTQSYKNIEYIIIDGSSTDGTVEVVDKYKSEITHFVSEPDDGVYEAMNKGINLATGDFILFLNANDSLYNENVIEIVADALNKNPESMLVFGDINYLMQDKKTSNVKAYGDVKNIFYFINNNICHQVIFYNKKLFDDFGEYSHEYKIYSDWDFNINCLVKQRIPCLYLPIIISNFLMGGLSSNPEYLNKYKLENALLLSNHYKKFLFLIKLDRFLNRYFHPIYKLFKNNFLFIKSCDAFMSHKKFKLNIKKAEVKDLKPKIFSE